MFQFFITCAPFHEGLLLEELKSLGIKNTKETHLGISFSGSLADAYRVLLWSRLGHHLLLKLRDFKATNQHALYHEISKIRWSDHFTPRQSFRIDILGKHSQFNHPHYIAQVMKDAIVDQMRKEFGQRPSIEREQPDIVLTLKVKQEEAQLYLDLSGESLHLRAYRNKSGAAPLKETLAAALLMRAGWLKRLENPDPILLDPMCGSGTILLEAAMMAFDIAPSLQRDYFGVLAWQQHDAKLWQKLLDEAMQRKAQGLQRQDVHLLGYDQNAKTLSYAVNAVANLGFSEKLLLENRDLANLALPETVPQRPGLIVTNPPYGVRLMTDAKDQVQSVLATFGTHLKMPSFQNWVLYILMHERELAKVLGIRLEKSYRFKNGDLECELLKFCIVPERFWHADFQKPPTT